MRLIVRLSLGAFALLGLGAYFAWSEVEKAGFVHERQLESAVSAFDEDQLKSGYLVFPILGILYMFMCLAIVVDDYFVPALEMLCVTLEVSDEVAGATFMAAGGSAPELFTSFIGTFTNSTVGFGTIVGSAVFNVLFVIAMCALFAKDTLTLTWWPLARDCSYYTFSLLMLAIFFGIHSENKIEGWEALVLFLCYIGYCFVMKNTRVLQAKFDKSFSGSTEGVPVKLHSQRFRMGILHMLLDKEDFDDAKFLFLFSIEGDAHQTFQDIDTSGDGKISVEELTTKLTQLIQPQLVTPEYISTMISSLTGDQAANEITEEQFVKWYKESSINVTLEIKNCFNELDEDKNGALDKEEVGKVLHKLNPDTPVSAAEQDELWAQLDTDGDGTVNLQEFDAWYKKTQFFREKKSDNLLWRRRKTKKTATTKKKSL
jgi:sodium/potassium/calcium exchanger 2